MNLSSMCYCLYIIIASIMMCSSFMIEHEERNERQLVSGSSRTWYFPGSSVAYYMIVNPFILPQKFTIEAWIKPATSSSSRFWLSWATSSNLNCIILRNSLTAGSWHYVVITWDGTNFITYANGVATPNMIEQSFCDSYSGILVLGQEQDSLGGGFVANQAADVYIDTVAIYNVSWSAAYVVSLTSSGKSCVEPDDATLHALWAADSTTDQSGNGYNADVFPFNTSKGVAGICPDPTMTPTISPFPSLAPTYFERPTSLPSEIPTYTPTPNPSRIPTPLPSMKPSISHRPTPKPSPTPTSAPTFLPTMVPSPPPTIQPSPIPTPQPSISSQPTNHPTPLPTYVPSNLPTNKPSPLPTATPTQYCGVGTYYLEGECVNCAIGRYSSISTAPWPSNCSLCPVGQYNTEVAQESCIECASGKLSSSDRTFCEDCSAGEYNFNNEKCVTCEYGKYAPTALTDACLECDAGFKTNNATGATLCVSCEAGTYSEGSVDYCSDCPRGKYSVFSAPLCTNCSVGFYAPATKSSTCSSCAAGTATNKVGATSCDDCEVGRYQPATSQTDCIDCSRGTYAANTGSLSCASCELAYDSYSGASECVLAAEDYYLAPFSFEAKACPNDANCAGSRQAPAPNKGSWVDRKKYKYAGDIYTCSRLTCRGSNSNGSCWNINAYNESYSSTYAHCQQDEKLLCSEGALGPLCGSCANGYIYRSELKQCGPCADAKASTFIAFGIGCFIALVSALLIFGFIPTTCFDHHEVRRVIRSVDSGSLKVLWVTFQIITSTTWNLDIQYPSPFSDMLGLLSVLSLDFLALECFQGDVQNRFFITVYLWSWIPIILAFCIVLLGITRILMIWKEEFWSEERKVEIVNQHIWMFLLLTYLVLPPVANKQLQSLDCIPFKHDGGSYLRQDTGVNCNSQEYLVFQGNVAVFIVVYQFIPIIWMILLYRQREQLDPLTSNHDEVLAHHMRENNDSLKPLRFLFKDYKCHKWWFEVAEMYRRMIFVGVLPLVSPVSATRASFGCVLAIASVVYFREEQPYRVKITNFIAYFAQFSILMTFYGALSIDTGVLIDFGLKDTGMGIFLILANLSILAMCIGLAYSRYRRDKLKHLLRRGKADLIEPAALFTEDKFKTTFASISRSSVPASHVLVFHYASLPMAEMARHSGIAAVEKYGGVPFTLRRPHETTLNDHTVFGASKHLDIGQGDGEGFQLDSGFPNDAVIACIIPTRSLTPLPGYETDTSLFRIPIEPLVAMRPSSFTSVINRAPWLNGVVMLPPTSITRSFSLVEMDEGLGSTLEAANVTKDIRSVYGERASALFMGRNQTSGSQSKKLTANKPTDQRQQKRDSAMMSSLSNLWIYESDFTRYGGMHSDIPIIKVNSVLDYLEGMRSARRKAAAKGLIPLYHYTQACVLPLIKQQGLRMSTQGQGDGGVYFSTKGPASYRLGSAKYEFNIIKDCFGLHRLSEYVGLGKLNAVLVYGCSHQTIQPAPGGRVHAKFVPRNFFEDFSLPHANSDFYLRPDLILAAFHIETNRIPSRAGWYQHDMELEVELDTELAKEIDEVQHALKQAADRVEELVLAAGIEVGGVEDESDYDYEDEDENDESGGGGSGSGGGVGGDGRDIEMISNNPMQNQLWSHSSSSNDMKKSETISSSSITSSPSLAARDFSAYKSSTMSQMLVDRVNSSSPPRTKPPSLLNDAPSSITVLDQGTTAEGRSEKVESRGAEESGGELLRKPTWGELDTMNGTELAFEESQVDDFSQQVTESISPASVTTPTSDWGSDV